MSYPDKRDYDTVEDFQQAVEDYGDYVDYMCDQIRDDAIMDRLDYESDEPSYDIQLEDEQD